MTPEKIANSIPKSIWKDTSEELIDLILSSSNGDKMPSDLAKTILFYWQRDQLATEIGLQRLIEASMILNKEKTLSKLEKLGLPELVVTLKNA